MMAISAIIRLYIDYFARLLNVTEWVNAWI